MLWLYNAEYLYRNRKHFFYKHTSPLVLAFYYCDEKYNFSEIKLNQKIIADILGVLFPRIIEDSIREFLAEHFGLSESVFVEKDFDIDACLLKFKKPEIVAEIKWKETIGPEDIRKVELNLGKITAKRRILFVPNKKKIKNKTELEIMDIFDFI